MNSIKRKLSNTEKNYPAKKLHKKNNLNESSLFTVEAIKNQNEAKENYNNYYESKLKKVLDTGRLITKHSPERESFMYNSKLGDPNLILNCKLLDVSGNLITCRQLSFANLNEKNYHKIFSSQKEIEKNSFLYNNKYDQYNICSKANHYYFFNLEYFGEALSKVANNMEFGSIKKMLFGTPFHLMSITIERKEIAYVIKFYDPNKTLVHMRAIYPTLEDIIAINIDNFINVYWLTSYFKDFKSAYLAVYDNYNELVKNPESIKEVPDQLETTIGEINWNEKIYYLQLNRLSSYLEIMMGKILRSKIPSVDKIKILLPKSVKGLPIIYIAFISEAIETVKVYIISILKASLTDEEKMELLLARNLLGSTAFYFVMYHNKLDIVRIFIELILNSNLKSKDRVSLLQGKNDKGMTALYYAMLSNNHEGVEVFCSLILDSRLDNQYKAELLLGSFSSGYGLPDAVENNSLKVVEVYIKLILSSNLDNQSKFNLLNIKSKGTPALHYAMQKGYKKIVEVYLELVLTSTLDKHKIVELLSQKDSENKIAIYYAIKNSDKDIIGTFKNLVGKLSLFTIDKA